MAGAISGLSDTPTATLGSDISSSTATDGTKSGIVLQQLIERQLSQALFLGQLKQATEAHDVLNMLYSLPPEA